jgi:hypothetical protein
MRAALHGSTRWIANGLGFVLLATGAGWAA